MTDFQYLCLIKGVCRGRYCFGNVDNPWILVYSYFQQTSLLILNLAAHEQNSWTQGENTDKSNVVDAFFFFF